MAAIAPHRKQENILDGWSSTFEAWLSNISAIVQQTSFFEHLFCFIYLSHNI